jgi:hypothetical protein
MDSRIARATLEVIRKDRKRRVASLPDEFSGDDLWPSVDEVFVNELCLMLLVAISHQVERELFSLAARATPDGQTLNYAQYQRRLKKLNKDKKKRWEKLVTTLRLDAVSEWRQMEVLRLLANSYKHSASQAPQKPLLRRLTLDEARNYASLSESPALREGLARSLRLDDGSDYCDIASEFLRCADGLLSTVRQQQTFSAVKGGRGGARPSNFRC